MNTRLLRPALFLIAGSVLATGLFAQTPAAAPAPKAAAPKIDFPTASPAASLKQRVGLTDIEVEYSRPGMKGRAIFGGLVPYGSVWRTGANTATKITFSTPVKFGGADVPAGSYALYSIPGVDEWTVILNKVTGQWGAYTYDEKNDLTRVKVKPVTLPAAVETFAIGFADLGSESATLYLTWEKTRVPVKLEFEVVSVIGPQIEAVMASADPKKPYFPAAMFYLEHNLDLKKAADWMDAAIAANPSAYYMIYRKALIQAKAGDKAGAIATARHSIEIASKDNGPAKDEYIHLNESLIASLK